MNGCPEILHGLAMQHSMNASNQHKRRQVKGADRQRVNPIAEVFAEGVAMEVWKESSALHVQVGGNLIAAMHGSCCLAPTSHAALLLECRLRLELSGDIFEWTQVSGLTFWRRAWSCRFG